MLVLFVRFRWYLVKEIGVGEGGTYRVNKRIAKKREKGTEKKGTL